MISQTNRKLSISLIKRNFCEFLRGTRGYKKKFAQETGRVGANQAENSPGASGVKMPPPHKKEEKENKVAFPKEEPITEEDFNRIEKEYHNKDSGRSMKGSSLGRKESRTKEFPHGYDKI